jgi:NAD(P)-dependent dehydrogenase (short-subunit alcohol dehydrogenase family)
MNQNHPLALISGGTSGIGLATAQRLVKDFRLGLLYAHNSERARAVESSFDNPERVKTFCIDVGLCDSVESGYAELVAYFGQAPQVLVNSAGIARFQQFFVQGKELDLAQSMMNINYFGSLRLIQKVLPTMYARRQGSIVNLSSVSGLGGNTGVIGYAESKAAVRCLTHNLAMEVAHRGVCINCVSPGRVATPMTEEFLQQFKKGSINFPLGRAITVEEVADTVKFLIDIGPALNGQNIILDGGTSLAKIQAEVKRG